MKASVFIALTLDGFIAGKDGSVDFLNDYQSSASKEDGDMGFSNFLNSVDLLVFGRKTWDQVISFGVDVWPYGDRKVWIWSRNPSDVHIPECIAKQAKAICASPPDIMKLAGDEGYQHAYIDGGTTIHEFLQHGYIQELILTRVPLLLGSGVPLFSSNTNKLPLEHLVTRSYSNGLVQSHYRVVKES
eukprot:CAMPEP_0172314508 /NCGR_PEP_ID=MMETSP1058-20130122/22722_1 /TAXON_ID=83371 /ORGANISM="Detonula confervacea, Strain CCMP 353" /LENGTH=186 /DNA_ID=CAMNT_0013028395 /DNA_START=139 /DNA_END=699 /DNA_ORIENTATION=-